MKARKITTPLKAKNMVVRVTPQDHRLIAEEAKKRKKIMSDFVREAVFAYIEMMQGTENNLSKSR